MNKITTAASAAIAVLALTAAGPALAGHGGGGHGGGHANGHAGRPAGHAGGGGMPGATANGASAWRGEERGPSQEAAVIRPRDYMFDTQRSWRGQSGHTRQIERRFDHDHFAQDRFDRDRFARQGFGRDRRFEFDGGYWWGPGYYGGPYYYGDDVDSGYSDQGPVADEGYSDAGPPVAQDGYGADQEAGGYYDAGPADQGGPPPGPGYGPPPGPGYGPPPGPGAWPDRGCSCGGWRPDGR
jgi:hypothetical protein